MKYKQNKLRIPIKLKGWRGKKLMIETTRWKKSAVRQLIEATPCDKWYLKVTYGKGKTSEGVEMIHNDGDYFNKKSVLRALTIFTSKTEINDYLDNYAIHN